MNIGKNAIYIIGLAIFLGAMLVMSDLILAFFAPFITGLGILGILVVFLLVLLGAWIMKKGAKP